MPVRITHWGGGEYCNPQNPEAVPRHRVLNDRSGEKSYVAVCGGRVLKSQSPLARPGSFNGVPNWWTTEEMSVLAKALNEIGRGCMESGVSLPSIRIIGR